MTSAAKWVQRAHQSRAERKAYEARWLEIMRQLRERP